MSWIILSKLSTRRVMLMISLKIILHSKRRCKLSMTSSRESKIPKQAKWSSSQIKSRQIKHPRSCGGFVQLTCSRTSFRKSRRRAFIRSWTCSSSCDCSRAHSSSTRSTRCSNSISRFLFCSWRREWRFRSRSASATPNYPWHTSTTIACLT